MEKIILKYEIEGKLWSQRKENYCLQLLFEMDYIIKCDAVAPHLWV